jgi:hypothetical protein
MATRFVTSLLLVSPLSAFAGVRCQAPQETGHAESGRMHTFSYTVRCTDSTPSLGSTAEKVLAYLKANGKVSNERAVAANGGTGKALVYAENRYDTGNGDIQKTYDVTSLTNAQKYEFSAVTSRIEATSHAKGTKKVTMKMTYLANGGVSLTETTQVEKPTLAPTSLFLKLAREGMSKHAAELANGFLQSVD